MSKVEIREGHICPKCDSSDSRIYDVREIEAYGWRRIRRRECKECKFRWVTCEVMFWDIVEHVQNEQSKFIEYSDIAILNGLIYNVRRNKREGNKTMKQVVKNYVKAVEMLIDMKGYEFANVANHEALEKKMIDLETFQAGAKIIAKAFLNR